MNSLTITAGVLLFVAMVVPLHFLQPGYDPANQLMSELALGPYGWTMVIAFAGLAMAMLGVLLATRAASVGLRALLALAALFFLAAGVFPLGETSDIHIVAIAVAFVLAVLAMYFYPPAVLPRAISWSLAAAVAASVVAGHTLLPMGIGQRLAAVFLLAWMLIVAWRLRA